MPLTVSIRFFQIKIVLNTFELIFIINPGINIISALIISHIFIEKLVTLLDKIHIIQFNLFVLQKTALLVD